MSDELVRHKALCGNPSCECSRNGEHDAYRHCAGCNEIVDCFPLEDTATPDEPWCSQCWTYEERRRLRLEVGELKKAKEHADGIVHSQTLEMNDLKVKLSQALMANDDLKANSVKEARQIGYSIRRALDGVSLSVHGSDELLAALTSSLDLPPGTEWKEVVKAFEQRKLYSQIQLVATKPPESPQAEDDMTDRMLDYEQHMIGVLKVARAQLKYEQKVGSSTMKLEGRVMAYAEALAYLNIFVKDKAGA